MAKHITDWLEHPKSENVFELEPGEMIIKQSSIGELVTTLVAINSYNNITDSKHINAALLDAMDSVNDLMDTSDKYIK